MALGSVGFENGDDKRAVWRSIAAFDIAPLSSPVIFHLS